MNKISRRSILKKSGITAGAVAMGLSSFPFDKETEQDDERKLKVVVIGAHPDDPETNCGGIISLFTNNGHEVVIGYLTRGEAGLTGKTYDEASKIRTSEAIEACKILNARPKFLGQIDGNCKITKESYLAVFNFLEKEKPDIIFNQWPIDTHRDHRICSTLVYDAWLYLGKQFEMYYSESMSGA